MKVAPESLPSKLKNFPLAGACQPVRMTSLAEKEQILASKQINNGHCCQILFDGLCPVAAGREACSTTIVTKLPTLFGARCVVIILHLVQFLS